jgi:hypothetical protein
MNIDILQKTIRIEADLYEAIRAAAAKESRSINEQMIYFIKLGMSVHKPKLK